jgi:prophage maintenance system killer protein
MLLEEKVDDKFNLSERESKFLAKKLIIESIYNLAKLEGCSITFLETQLIYNGINDSNVTMDDVRVVRNLKAAWEFYLNREFGTELNLEFLLAVNKRVSNNESLDWGVLRYGNIGISGTNRKPKVPEEQEVREQLEEMKLITNKTLRALKLFLWMCKSQLFWDGNKRSASICCNKVLLDNGCGLLVIQEKDLKEFNTLLSNSYETNQDKEIINFLYEKCIIGIEY